MELERKDWLMGGAALLLLLLPVILFWSRLPEPLATHFGPGGQPDDKLPKGTLLGFTLLLWGLTWAAYLMMRYKTPSTWKPPFTFGALGVVFAVQLSIVESNLGASHWRLAEPLVGLPEVVALAVGWIAFGLVAYAVERR